jgi:hypothetical protein
MAKRAQAEQRQVLDRWVRRPTSAQALALRARIVLRLAEEHSSLRGIAEYRISQQETLLGFSAVCGGQSRHVVI